MLSVSVFLFLFFLLPYLPVSSSASLQQESLPHMSLVLLMASFLLKEFFIAIVACSGVRLWVSIKCSHTIVIVTDVV